VAAVGFLTIALFQAALALGAPLGRAAYGGVHDGQLPTGLRMASAFATIVWALAAMIVLGRAGFEITPGKTACRHFMAAQRGRVGRCGSGSRLLERWRCEHAASAHIDIPLKSLPDLEVGCRPSDAAHLAPVGVQLCRPRLYYR